MNQVVAERYRLEVRLGRDADVEQWLGTDTFLDRPVLVRLLGADSSEERRRSFLAAVSAAAAVSHVHLSAVFAADLLEHGAYAVQEWAGGVTLADRLDAGESVAPDEFLPNAAGLAAALAALHASGGSHGAIDPAAVMYSAAHPAKLDGFGRGSAPAGGPAEDVVALGRALRMAIGGEEGLGAAGMGMSPVVADALERAVAGRIDAAGLAAALRAAPSARRPRRPAEWSWRWVAVAAIILAVAAAVAGVGLALRVRPSDSPLLFPAVPVTGKAAEPTSTTAPAPPRQPPPSAVAVAAVASYDPFGTGGERDGDLDLLGDGDPATGWRTERYFDPLPRIKPGVGVAFTMTGSPGALDLTASSGTGYRIAWATAIPDDFSSWEETAAGLIDGGRVRIQLPRRDDGAWLVWLTDLPAEGVGEDFYAFVYEVRFRG